jgi:predicted Rossmann-fold nucleotide-binding protein
LFEVWTWAQLGLHSKPCGLLNASGYYEPLIEFLNHARDEGFVRRELRAALVVDHDPHRLLDQLISTG